MSSGLYQSRAHELNVYQQRDFVDSKLERSKVVFFSSVCLSKDKENMIFTIYTCSNLLVVLDVSDHFPKYLAEFLNTTEPPPNISAEGIGNSGSTSYASRPHFHTTLL